MTAAEVRDLVVVHAAALLYAAGQVLSSLATRMLRRRFPDPADTLLADLDADLDAAVADEAPPLPAGDDMGPAWPPLYPHGRG